MVRKQRIRASEEEVQVLKDAREKLYEEPEHIPLGIVIAKLVEEHEF